MNIKALESFEQLAETLSMIPAADRAEFFRRLEGPLTAEEVRSLQVGCSLYGLFTNPEKYAAFKAAMAEILVDEFKPTF